MPHLSATAVAWLENSRCSFAEQLSRHFPWSLPAPGQVEGYFSARLAVLFAAIRSAGRCSAAVGPLSRLPSCDDQRSVRAAVAQIRRAHQGHRGHVTGSV